MTDAQHGETAADGTWIMLRGLGRESAHWMDFVAELRRHLPHQRVACIDWRGNGEYVRQQSPWTIADGVAQLRQECAARQLASPYVLVGISMGGMAAIDWLAHYPEEVSHVHAINTSIAGISYWHERLRISSLLRLLVSARSTREREHAVAAVTLSPEAASDAIVDQWVDIAGRRPVAISNLLKQIWSAAQFKLRKPQHTERLTLYVSAGDRLVSPECSHDIARLWGIELVEHPAAGHDLPLDDGEWLLQQLLKDRHPSNSALHASIVTDEDLLVHLHRSLSSESLAGWSAGADRR